MSWITLGSTDVHYEEYGSRSDRPLVFVHGNNACLEGWHQQIDAFRGSYHVFAFDSVNHGLSSNSPLGEVEPDRVKELEDFLAAMGIREPVVVGHSMGGGTVLRWLTRHPNEAVAAVLSGSGVAPQPEPGQPATPPAAVETMADEQLMVPMGDNFTEQFQRDESVRYQRYERIRSTATRIEFLRHPRARHQPAPTGLEYEALVRNIETPMLLLVGALDGAVRSARHLHELVPTSQLIEFPGMKHNFYYEIGDQHIEAMSTFLAAHSLPTAGVAVS